MSHKMLRTFIVKLSYYLTKLYNKLGYFPLHYMIICLIIHK